MTQLLRDVCSSRHRHDPDVAKLCEVLSDHVSTVAVEVRHAKTDFGLLKQIVIYFLATSQVHLKLLNEIAQALGTDNIVIAQTREEIEIKTNNRQLKLRPSLKIVITK